MTLLGDKQIETFPGSSFNGRSAHTPGLETASGARSTRRFDVPASQLPAPKFNLELGPFYLSGNEVYTDSNECNLVNNGKGDWKIKFDNSGEDLKGSLANPPCPF